MSLLERNALPVAYTWDAHSVFGDDTAWQAALDEVTGHIEGLQAFQGRLAEGPTVLADYLELAEHVLRLSGKVSVYARMFYAVNTLDQTAKARVDRAASLQVRLSTATAFSGPELLALGAATLQQWVAQEPRLAIFAHHFDRLHRSAPHVRSAEVEALLRQASEPFDAAATVHGILTNADLRFEPARDQTGETYELAQGNINALVTHIDPAVRQSAWQHYADAHLALKNTMAACLATEVRRNVFNARARGYRSALDAALTPNHIPLEVFHQLI
ncbi:MAG: oligoendopeptidase F, partial [Chloroflexia bacterium]|nr:oligoendopeptidase F [Chloroflexia bacterium]